MKKKQALPKNEFEKDYSKIFEDNKKYSNLTQSVEWQKSGDVFEKFSLLRSGYTNISSETQFLENNG